eukprot:TRINITY_DN47735_c0_g1_i2.p1 TRINITY_DN47735_c0_g1~~TRINITY_DN47735_c0_g1_i2.p1  ORF type:complete len:129 (-),score=14.79 TRINITY_DN47735_c0_g1_i2:9-395(-)
MSVGWWQYKDDDGEWASHSSADAKKLEDALKDGETDLKCKLSGRSYMICFTAMTQKNTISGTKRKIRRLKSKSVSKWLYQDDDGTSWLALGSTECNALSCAADSGLDRIKLIVNGNVCSMGADKATCL